MPDEVGIPNWFITCGDVNVRSLSPTTWCMSVKQDRIHRRHYIDHADYRNMNRRQAMHRFVAQVNTGASI